MCGVGKAERAERSGLPVMLSVSETSHFSKRSPCGVPSLTLRMTLRTFFVAMTKKCLSIQCGQKTIINITLK
jgi:hypothetical protein